MRFLVVPDTAAFQGDAYAALGRVLDKIQLLELNEDFAGREWRSTRSYLDTMCRRLKEAVSVTVPE